MTARSRWVIAASAIVLVIVVVAFVGTMRSRNSVQARGIGSENAARRLSSPPPEESRALRKRHR